MRKLKSTSEAFEPAVVHLVESASAAEQNALDSIRDDYPAWPNAADDAPADWSNPAARHVVGVVLGGYEAVFEYRDNPNPNGRKLRRVVLTGEWEGVPD